MNESVNQEASERTKVEDTLQETPKENKRYGIRIPSIYGNQTFPLDLDEYSTADSAKIPGVRYANPLGMGPTGLTPVRPQEFVEIDENGKEIILTDKEMDKIIEDYQTEKETQSKNKTN